MVGPNPATTAQCFLLTGRLYWLAVGLRRSRKRVLGFRRKILVALEHENHKELPADVSFDPTITPHSCALSRNDIGVFQWRFQATADVKVCSRHLQPLTI